MSEDVRKSIIGEPVKELPKPDRGGGVNMHLIDWEAVRRKCKKNPNMWVPIHIFGSSPGYAATAATNIRSGNIVMSRDAPWDWDAATRGGVLYVKYSHVNQK
jgi:hypothetical protein